jgi:tetratricopeptide (TPR) repeat protein
MGSEQFCHPDSLVIRAEKRIHRVEANCPFLKRSDVGDCTCHKLTSAKQSIGVSRITIERDRQIGLVNALATGAVGLFGIKDIDSLRRARDLIDSGLAAVPNSALAHYSKAKVLQAQGDCQDAIGEYEMTIALDRNTTNAYALLGACKLVTGAIADVAPLEKRAIRLDPMDPFFGAYYQRIGMAELFRSHIDQAVSLLEKARTAYAIRQNEGVYPANCRRLCAERRHPPRRGRISRSA